MRGSSDSPVQQSLLSFGHIDSDSAACKSTAATFSALIAIINNCYNAGGARNVPHRRSSLFDSTASASAFQLQHYQQHRYRRTISAAPATAVKQKWHQSQQLCLHDNTAFVCKGRSLGTSAAATATAEHRLHHAISIVTNTSAAVSTATGSGCTNAFAAAPAPAR